MDFRGKRVTVMGLGRFGGGVGAVRFLAARGAQVTVSDAAPANKLAESLEQIRDLPVALHLGGHERSDFSDADLVVVNPAVPKTAEELDAVEETIGAHDVKWTPSLATGLVVGATAGVAVYFAVIAILPWVGQIQMIK